MGTLYICATPIGNLEDVSIRLLKTLRQVDVIACEDTRQTAKLLQRYRIKARTVSYHRFNLRSREAELIEYLCSGQDVALVSDAGMPLFRSRKGTGAKSHSGRDESGGYSRAFGPDFSPGHFRSGYHSFRFRRVFADQSRTASGEAGQPGR